MELVESSQGNTAVTSRLVGGETNEPVFRLNLPSGFSVVVDDVDTGSHEQLQLEAEERLEPQPQPRAKTPEGQDEAATQEQPPDARIRQIQVEAESRKSEFARLLEEHAQVVMQLKQMESDEAVLTPPTTTTSA